MICGKCKTKNSDGAKFCASCGNGLKTSPKMDNKVIQDNNSSACCPQCNKTSLSETKKNFFSTSQRYFCSTCSYQGPLLLKESARIAWGTVAVIAMLVIVSVAFGNPGGLGILGIIGLAKYWEDYKYRKIVNQYRISYNLPSYKGNESNGLTKGVIYAILIIAFTFGVGALLNEETASTSTIGNTTKDTQSFISETVEQLKNEMNLPQQIDTNTTLLNVIAHPKAIRYHYSLSGLDVSDLTNELIKSTLLDNMCYEKDIQALLEQNINMEYSYEDSITKKTFFVVISKADCSF